MFALIAVLLLSDTPAPRPQPVAMVLSQKGMVTLESGGKKGRRAEVMDLLRPDDRLSTAKESETVVVFPADGHIERIKAGSQVTVGRQSCTPPSAVERLPAASLSKANLQYLREDVQKERIGGAGLRDREDSSPATTPLDGARVLDVRPTFSWPAHPGAMAYVVEVRDRSGETMIWRAETREPRLAYPKGKAPLAQGRFEVKHHLVVRARVREKDEEKLVDTVRSVFFVMPKEQVEEVAQLEKLAAEESVSGLLLAAATYEAYSVHDRALQLYERLAAKLPEEPRLQRVLARYYKRAGQPDRAKAALEKANKLSPPPDDLR